MHILLVGAGYVGMALLGSWENPKDHFFATTTTEAKVQKIQSYSLVEKTHAIKITESTDLEIFLDECDAVIFTIAPKKDSNYKETYLATALAFSKALKNRKKPLFVLYTSSTSVYGNQKGALVEETSSRIPLSETSKILSEVEDVFLSCANPKVEVCILRLGGIYGPKRTLEDRAIKMSKKNLLGCGQEATNHIHLEDITDAIEFSIKNRLKGVYNLVNDAHPNRKQLYDHICARLKISPPNWECEDSARRVTDVIVSNKKIKQCGYTFKYPNLPFSIGDETLLR